MDESHRLRGPAEMVSLATDEGLRAQPVPQRQTVRPRALRPEGLRMTLPAPRRIREVRSAQVPRQSLVLRLD
jgi:hypothetical protein